MSNKKDIPKFKSEKEEAKFWEGHDSTEYVDWSNAKDVTLSNLKASTKTISLRLPKGLLEDIQMLAHKRDVPYQSYLKIMLANAVDNELHQQ